MGITLQGYNISTDIPYSGFFRMRRDIAYMMSDDIGTWYEKMPALLHYSDKEKETWENNINKAIDNYMKTHIKSMEKVVDFLFMSDCEGKITYGTCKLICKILTASDTEKFFSSVYGYAGWKDKACHGRDIYRILKSCSDNKRSLKWG